MNAHPVTFAAPAAVLSAAVQFVHESGPAPDGAHGFACFSPDRRYRWSLHRAWAGAGPPMAFVMLNPSTAGARADDATIRRCRGFAEREGCASLVVVNLFALVSPSPRALLTDPDPAGAAWGDEFIVRACTGPREPVVVVAWGANAGHPRLRARASEVLDLLAAHQVHYRALGITADGHPAHPLRLRKDAPLRPGPGAAPSAREPRKDTVHVQQGEPRRIAAKHHAGAAYSRQTSSQTGAHSSCQRPPPEGARSIARRVAQPPACGD